MKHLLRHGLTLVLLTVLVQLTVQAQYRVAPNPAPSEPPPSVLYPEPTYWWLGLLIGADINQHSGDFLTTTCDRIFEEAEGDGIYLGAQLEHRMSDMFTWVVRAAYNDFSAQGSYLERDVPTEVQVIDNGNVTTVTENLDHTYASDVKLSYFSLNPFIEFFPVGNLYLFGGPSVGFLMNAQYNCTDDVGDEFVFVRDEQSITAEDDADIPEAGSIRIDLRGGIGYNLRLSKSITLAPEIGYNFGLTTISDDDDWTAHAFTAVAVLKIDL